MDYFWQIDPKILLLHTVLKFHGKQQITINRDYLWQIDPIKKILIITLFQKNSTMDFNEIIIIFGNYQLYKKKKIDRLNTVLINSNETMNYDQL